MGVADEFRVGGVTTCETPSHHAGQSAGRGVRREPAGIAATLRDAPWSRRAAPEGPSPPSSGLAVAEALARWCGWGSWDDSGRAVVQICCKGAPGRDRPRMKARNINDSLPVPRRDPGLCNRFGQTTSPRATRRGAEGRTGDLAGRVAAPGVLGVVAIPAGPLAGGPEARGRPRRIVCYASSRLLRPFTLRCTRKRGVAEGEGAQQREKSVVDAGPAAGFSAFSGAWRRRPRRGAGGSPGVRASGRCAPSRCTPPPGPPIPRRR